MISNITLRGFILIILAILGGLIFLWLMMCYAVRTVAGMIVFREERSFSRVPNLPYEQIFVKNSNDESLDFWWLPNPHSHEAILYLHGNSGRLPHFFPPLSKNYNVLAPSYPGFGLSEGSPTEENVYETAELAYKWLLKRGFKENQIIIWGHSLGGSPAINLAMKYPNRKKLVVVNSFSSMKNISKHRSPFLSVFLDHATFNSMKDAEKVEGNVVHFCYRHDKTIPFEDGRRLFGSFKTQDKKFFELQGDTHEFFDVESTLRDY